MRPVLFAPCDRALSPRFSEPQRSLLVPNSFPFYTLLPIPLQMAWGCVALWHRLENDPAQKSLAAVMIIWVFSVYSAHQLLLAIWALYRDRAEGPRQRIYRMGLEYSVPLSGTLGLKKPPQQPPADAKTAPAPEPVSSVCISNNLTLLYDIVGSGILYNMIGLHMIMITHYPKEFYTRAITSCMCFVAATW